LLKKFLGSVELGARGPQFDLPPPDFQKPALLVRHRRLLRPTQGCSHQNANDD
jgi:hypothetical protein